MAQCAAGDRFGLQDIATWIRFLGAMRFTPCILRGKRDAEILCSRERPQIVRLMQLCRIVGGNIKEAKCSFARHERKRLNVSQVEAVAALDMPLRGAVAARNACVDRGCSDDSAAL
jgi:hypothetical protein